jgi:L,D-peptidoglycan transpeptidase YkuD (ErfK/YbiS/YcfS/YnhG family)
VSSSRPAVAAAVLAVGLVAGCAASAPPPAKHAAERVAAVSSTTALPDRIRGVRDARQVLVVSADGYRTTDALLRGFRYRDGRWRLSFGPWHAYLGGRGFARPGNKREGDRQTPTGSYTFPFAFGVDPDPGTRLRYRRALDTSRWDDDPTSANYNRWVDIRYGDPGADPEHMRLLPQYRYGVVIGYNLDRTPYLGSAIFLHVDDGGPTAGCVAISRHRMVRVLRWLRPGLDPRVVMGPKSWLTS